MASTQDNKISMEEQFILRLPLQEAIIIRELLHQKPNKLKKNLKIGIDVDSNKVILDIIDVKLYGTLKKLPTIIESYKTNLCGNKSTLYKVADLCHIVHCNYEESTTDRNESTHGYCPPLKNAKKKRFRKTMYNENAALEAESVSKELYYLLSTDLEAISSRFEILYEGNSDHQKPPEQSETWLFGQLSSDSEVEYILFIYLFIVRIFNQANLLRSGNKINLENKLINVFQPQNSFSKYCLSQSIFQMRNVFIKHLSQISLVEVHLLPKLLLTDENTALDVLTKYFRNMELNHLDCLQYLIVRIEEHFCS